MWSALYQGHPAPEDGDFFRADSIKLCDHLPEKEEMRVYMGCDFALTADGGDWTVMAVVGIDHSGRMYLLDLYRRQTTSDQFVEAFCDLVIKHKPMAAPPRPADICRHRAVPGSPPDGAAGLLRSRAVSDAR